MKKNIVIIGGVALGASAATKLRRLNEKANIIIIEKDEYVSFANCGLPYYVGDVIKNRDDLILQTKESLKAMYNIDVRTNSEALSIDRKKKQVIVLNREENNEYTLKYDYLILAPGSSPIIPEIEGIETTNNVFTIRNIPDVDKIKDYIEINEVKKACVVGAGFIGLEMAENLKELGLDVTVLNLTDQVLPNLDFEIAKMVENRMKEQKINFIFNQSIQAFLNHGHTIKLSDNSLFDTDMVILAVGVTPNTKLASEASLRLNKDKAIKVNRFNQTNDKSIYAGGDAIEVNNFVSKKPSKIPLAGPANAQAIYIANHIENKKKPYLGNMATSVIKIFDYVAASTGLNEEQAKQLAFNVKSVIVHRSNHASYYPNATTITLKLVFDLTTKKVLGAQAFGKEGVEKRIDVIATALFHGAVIDDLCDYQLAYAPPFSSAKDPVNIAGYVANHLIDQRYQTFSPLEVDRLIEEGISIIDVRSEDEFNEGSFENAINIPITELRNRLKEISRTKDVYLACQVGQRGYLASQILKASGFKKTIYNLSGGYYSYQELHKEYETVSKVVTPNNNNNSSQECINVLISMINNAKVDETIEMQCSDLSFFDDVKALTLKEQIKIIDLKIIKDQVVVKIIKQETTIKTKQTIIAFSSDLDKLLSTFMIANARLEQGYQVDILFTFWGISLLRKDYLKYTNKSFIDRFIGFVLPHGTKHLPISKHNYLGLGSYFMKYSIEQKNLESLDMFMEKFIIGGGSFSVDTYSMDLLGFKKEELIDDINYTAINNFLASQNDVINNLFI